MDPSILQYQTPFQMVLRKEEEQKEQESQEIAYDLHDFFADFPATCTYYFDNPLLMQVEPCATPPKQAPKARLSLRSLVFGESVDLDEDSDDEQTPVTNGKERAKSESGAENRRSLAATLLRKLTLGSADDEEDDLEENRQSPRFTVKLHRKQRLVDRTHSSKDLWTGKRSSLLRKRPSRQRTSVENIDTNRHGKFRPVSMIKLLHHHPSVSV